MLTPNAHNLCLIKHGKKKTKLCEKCSKFPGITDGIFQIRKASLFDRGFMIRMCLPSDSSVFKQKMYPAVMMKYLTKTKKPRYFVPSSEVKQDVTNPNCLVTSQRDGIMIDMVPERVLMAEDNIIYEIASEPRMMPAWLFWIFFSLMLFGTCCLAPLRLILSTSCCRNEPAP